MNCFSYLMYLPTGKYELLLIIDIILYRKLLKMHVLLTKMPIARYSNAYCKKLYICSNQSQAVENTSKVQKKIAHWPKVLSSSQMQASHDLTMEPAVASYSMKRPSMYLVSENLTGLPSWRQTLLLLRLQYNWCCCCADLIKEEMSSCYPY